jgi:hypothetical protein
MRNNLSATRIVISSCTKCSLVWGVLLAMMVTAATAQQTGSASSEEEQQAGSGATAEPGTFPLEEPKALLEPAQLIPVESTETPPLGGEVAPASAPPVRLAPAPLPLAVERSKQITNEVDGVRPASFKEITPGDTTAEDVVEKLGDPLETTTREGQEELVYKLGPFPSVRITIIDKVVSSIVIGLAAPTPRSDVVKELKLDDFEPVTILDDSDRALGEVYPERGLMFAFQGDVAEGEEAKVGQVVLERVSVEPFLLRVESLSDEQLSERIRTLRLVQKLLPEDAEAYALSAELDLQCGRLASAQQSAQKALELDADNAAYRILLADINRQLGQQQEALQSVRAVLAEGKLETLEKARAQFILGRLLAATPLHDYKQAMQETVTAVKLAAGETHAKPHRTRRAARRLLIRAELSLAEILSYGPWKQRHSVVPQWLASAEKAANEHIEQDGATRDVLLDLYTTSLHCLFVLDGQGSPTKIADAAIDLGRSLIAESEDLDYQTLVEWKLGTALWRAAQIEQQQGNASESLRLANNAEALLSAAGELRNSSPAAAHHLAQLRFLMGSIHAIYKRDDTTATYWYDKAMPELLEGFPDSLLDNRGLVGEQLVSVGISLWETGRRNKAISVTRDGAEMIDEAVQAGSFKDTALTVPYQNLAEMYREMGNESEAEKMARKAAQYEEDSALEEIRR